MEIRGCSNEYCKCFDGCSSGSKMDYPPCAKNAMESGTNSIQQLRAEIAAVVDQAFIQFSYKDFESLGHTICKLQQLSAI